VWLEAVPPNWIGTARWTPNVERWEIGFQAWVHGEGREGLRLNVKLHVGDLLLADDTYQVVSGEVHRRIALSDPGIDDYRNELLWSPATPTIMEAELKLWGGRGDLVDTARSYTALRSIGVQGDKFVLNGRPYILRMVLDQGYWPQSGLDGLTTMLCGVTSSWPRPWVSMGPRKIKRSRIRGTCMADHLGLVVWEEMPSAYRYTKVSIERLAREWMEVIDRDTSHPCIVAWVPFNESWGVPTFPTAPRSATTCRHFITSPRPWIRRVPWLATTAGRA
jgi:hypothetical protein